MWGDLKNNVPWTQGKNDFVFILFQTYKSLNNLSNVVHLLTTHNEYDKVVNASIIHNSNQWSRYIYRKGQVGGLIYPAQSQKDNN